MSQYFENLNYTLSNEDTRIEYRLCPEGLSRIFCIGGSGARVMPLLAKRPDVLDIVDLSQEQLALIELRIAAARQLSRDEFLFFLGYRGGLPGDGATEDNRAALFDQLDLKPETKAFWSDREAAWRPRGFILLGRWEGHFQKLGRIFRDVLRIDSRKIFSAHSLEEQRRLFDEHFKPLAFKAFIKVAASEFVFNRFLYKGHFSGRSDTRTESRSPSSFIEEEFTRLFQQTLVRKNYFLQVLFLGEVAHEEALPIECRSEVLELVKKSKTRVNYRKENLLDVINKDTYEFLSLSDTISYLPAEAAHGLLTNLPTTTPSGSRAVIRSFLRRPPHFETRGWKRLEADEAWAKALDTTGVYEFDIFEKL